MKTALITGITGQDGSYLAELLLDEGYRVFGAMRRASLFNTQRINHLYKKYNRDRFDTHYADLTDILSVGKIIDDFKPDEIYNLAAMSQVGVSFKIPEYTLETNAIGPLNILEYIRNYSPGTKFYQASSSEMFGVTRDEPPFNESSEMRPQSPYGISKLAAFHATRIYRKGYDLYAATGILFNHESPRRGETFVTRKITRTIAAILRGDEEKLSLGNINTKRDWGHSKDYMEAIHLIMQQPEPGEYVVATGETATIREAVTHCFSLVGIDLEWKGKGFEEKGVDKKTNKVYVDINERHFRPNDVPYLQGDSSKIRKLGWKPEYKWKDVLKEMIENDIKLGGSAPTEYIKTD